MTAFHSLIPAAGVGARMGAAQPKQYLPLAGKPVLRHVLDTFAASAAIAHTWVVVAASDPVIDGLIEAAPSLATSVTVVAGGGATRRETVRNGLDAMRASLADDDWVLVHDAARPGLTEAMLEAMIAALRDDPVGGLLALPLADTIKRADAQGRSCGTVPREGLWAAQTPQMFRYRLLCQALAQDAAFTDEASAIEALGLQPKLVVGDPRNVKITLPADLVLAGLYFDDAGPLKTEGKEAK
jgi:2-C-methyl-D-erythritol 4-phosphate cytidylyltransferase